MPGNGLPDGGCITGEIADDKDLWVFGDGKIALHNHPTAAIKHRARGACQRLTQLRGAHARGHTELYARQSIHAGYCAQRRPRPDEVR